MWTPRWMFNPLYLLSSSTCTPMEWNSRRFRFSVSESDMVSTCGRVATGWKGGWREKAGESPRKNGLENWTKRQDKIKEEKGRKPIGWEMETDTVVGCDEQNSERSNNPRERGKYIWEYKNENNIKWKLKGKESDQITQRERERFIKV